MTRYLAIFFLLMLTACGNLSQPFGKDEAGNNTPSITAPPWEALVAAGPDASKDIDLETLNGPIAEAPPEVAAPPDVVAADVPPEPETESKAKPTGTVIKAVAVVPVTGAKGKGNAELTKAMRTTLSRAGWTVLNAPAKNALTILGQVDLAPPAGETQKVSLRWDVQTPDGNSLGDVKQANDVPKGSLDAGWGENASFAAEAAATGIFELINKYR